MSILSSMKQSIKASLVAALVIGTGALALNGSAHAIGLSGPQDCDANAVIFCGAQSTQTLITKYTNGTTQNSAKSIHDIYAKFGISAAEVNAMNSTAVAGSVTKGNEVIVGGKVVAKNALTAGRETIGNSTPVTYNGTAFFTRAPSVSFISSSIPAYVVMKNNVFQYAIIASCANPVTGTPTTTPPPVTPPATPNYTIVKTVSVKDTANYQNSISGLKPGTHVYYQIVVKSTGKAAVTNLVVKDKLPAHVTYVPNTLSRDGNVVAGTTFFSNGVTIASLAAGATTSFKFEAVIGTTSIGTTCTNESLTNTGTIMATSLPTTSDTATVATKCAPVVIVNAPVCKNFEIAAGDNRTIHVTNFDYAANDAKFVSAIINWDQGPDKTNVSTAAITNPASVVGQTHQYAADGIYLVTVTINFLLNNKPVTASGVQCEKQVTFSTAPPVIVPPVTPPVVTPPVVTPPVVKATALVNTGAGSTAALFGGASVLAFAAYQWSLRRRLSL